MNIQLAKYALSILLSLILVVSLVFFSNITFAEFSVALAAISLPQALAILACTAAFVFLSSLKWRMVMRLIGQESRHLDRWGPYIYYTSLGAALSVVLTVHLSVAVARAFGAKLHLRQSPVVGAGASVYEQMFDLGVLLLFVLPAVGGLLLGFDPWGWAVAATAVLATAGTSVWFITRFGHRSLATFSCFLARHLGRFKTAANFFANDQSRALFEPFFVLQVLCISIARYLVLMLRAFLVLWAAQIPIAGADFLNAFPVVQISQIVAVTPGGIGISEWTWSGILTWWGYPANVAAQFALVNRVANSLSLIAVFACVALAISRLSKWKRRDDMCHASQIATDTLSMRDRSI